MAPDGSGTSGDAIFEAHYFRRLFPDARRAPSGRRAPRGLPGVIVQGRYDLLCPPATSFALAEAWPDARVEMVEGAGHAMTEPGVMAAMSAAIDEIAAGDRGR
jgi:proline iminopeptidase